NAYRAEVKRSILQLIATTTPFIALLALMAWASHDRYWLTLLLAIPAAGLLVRLFIIQHDCGHGSFFQSRATNDFVVRAISLLHLALLVAVRVPCGLLAVLPVLLRCLPVIIMASWVGNWLFFVQHQFEAAHWERDGNWNFHIAAVAGSSYFELPPILQWFSGTI